MDNEDHFIDAKEEVWQASYRLEVLGEMLVVEARELRDAMLRVEDRKDYLASCGVMPDIAAKVDSTGRKLRGEVEHDVRYLIDVIREQGRTLRQLAQ